MPPLRFVVVGFGDRGRNHAAGLSSVPGFQARCAAVCDPCPPAPERLEELGARHCRAPRDLLREAPDFAVVASPEALHADHALFFLRRGIPVYLEKAVSNAWAGAVRFYREVVRRRLPVFVGYNMRRYPPARLVERLVRRGEIGWVQSVLGHVNAGTDWAAVVFLERYYGDASLSGDIVLSKLTHDSDWVQRLLRSRAAAVCAAVTRNVWGVRRNLAIGRSRRAALARLRPPSSHDAAAVTGLLQNGALFTFVFTTTGPDYERRYILNGTRGQIEMVLHTSRPGSARSRVTLWRHGGGPREIPVPVPAGGHGGADPVIHAEFLRWVRGRPRGPHDPDSILDGMVVPTAALDAARTGRAVDCAERVARAKQGLR